ncbi:Protein ROS1 [Striga hermonthica]|uniref:Protein ROS1 n=1 Tax=Striga hermonthica TaxID=68872 RepID=A0A9N7NVP1_STRHE|nr:Protein ROS1 [Striga hermonthica]
MMAKSISAKSSEGPQPELESSACCPKNDLVYTRRKKYGKKPPVPQNVLVYTRKKNAKKSNEIDNEGKHLAPKVELDERTMREWEISTGKLDSSKDPVEGEIEWWEKERRSFVERVESFVSSIRPIQEIFIFSLLLSSSAFISLAAKYPLEAAQVHFLPPESEKMALRSSGSKAKEHEVMLHTMGKGRGVKIRKRSEDGWDALKKRYMEGEFGDDTYDNHTSDALDWKAVQMAEVDEIAKAIEKRGMSNNLATRIKNCLNMLATNVGSLNLEWIKGVPDNTAREHLLSISGLGLKSVECIRLLSL